MGDNVTGTVRLAGLVKGPPHTGKGGPGIRPLVSPPPLKTILYSRIVHPNDRRLARGLLACQPVSHVTLAAGETPPASYRSS